MKMIGFKPIPVWFIFLALVSTTKTHRNRAQRQERIPYTLSPIKLVNRTWLYSEELKEPKNITVDISSNVKENQLLILNIIRLLGSGNISDAKMLLDDSPQINITDEFWLDSNFQFDHSVVHKFAKSFCNHQEDFKRISHLLIQLCIRHEIFNDAVTGGDNELVNCLLGAGLDLTAFGSRALVAAWKNDQTDTAALLIQKLAEQPFSTKAAINVTNSKGRTLLHFAAERGLQELGQDLIDNGAEIDSKDYEYLTPLYLAIENETGMVDYLLDYSARIHTMTPHKNSFLHLAVIRGSTAAIRDLLNNHGLYVDTMNGDNLTPFYLAVELGKSDIIEQLKSSGADPDAKSELGNNLLHTAVSRGSFNTVKGLVKAGSQINSLNYDGLTPLFLAAEIKLSEIMEFLIMNGGKCAERDFSLLHLAAKRGNLTAIELLIDHCSPVDSLDKRGEPALYSAARAEKIEAMELLLSRGADLYITLEDGNRLIHHASVNGHVEGIKSLLRVGTYVDLKNSEGLTALCKAVQADNIETVSYLIEKGANDSFTSMAGDTLLHLAARYNSFKSIRLLTQRGLYIDKENDHQETPLYTAAKYDNKNLADFLMTLSADKNHISASGDYLVHQSIVKGHIDVLSYLIKADANLNVTNGEGITPLYLAVRKCVSENVFDGRAARLLLASNVELFFTE